MDKPLMTSTKLPARCPRCGSQHLSRSHRKNAFERLLSHVFLPWRCRDCYARFFRSRWANIQEESPPKARAANSNG
jgi:uncharacterized protein with PIN domain